MSVRLTSLLSQLRRLHGAPVRREPKGAFEMVLFENASYLVDDETKAEVFASLARTIGTSPDAILRAPRAKLLRAIAKGGMLAPHRADKVRKAAMIAEALPAPLDAIVKSDLTAARKALRKMPSIGEPGADKIALFAGGHRVMAVDSNGLRALVRFGFGREGKSYAATYRSAIAALEGQLPRTRKGLIDAYLLLREHGRTLPKK